MTYIIALHGAVSLPEKSPHAPLNPSLLPSQLLATTDLFTVIIVLPFPESHTAGIMPYGAFQTDCFHLVMDI